MNKPSYEFEQSNNQLTYKFWSVGNKGEVLKAVIFQQVSEEVFNVVLGDFDEETETINDQSITDNGDMPKIIATVIHCIDNFFESYQEKLVYIEGNHPIKQKLYQRAIKNNLQDIEIHYKVFGVLPHEDIEIFNAEQAYTAFIIQRKTPSI